MPDKFKIVTAILAVAYAHETFTHYRSLKKLDKERKYVAVLTNLLDFNLKQSAYLAQMLDTNEITVTEFDRIAMNNL